MIRLSYAALAAAISLVAAVPASASVVLDQADIPETGTIGFAGGTGFNLGTGGIVQTFTVGVSGVLDHVSVDVENWSFLGPAAGVRIQVVNSSFSSLFSHDVAAASLPVFGFSGFDFANVLNVDVSAAAIHMLAGDTFGIRVSSLDGSDSAQVWRSAFSGASIDYSGGSAFSYDVPPSFPTPFPLGNDFGFRTYVDTGGATAGGAPEPQTWALALLGFAIVGGALRAQRPARLTKAA